MSHRCQQYIGILSFIIQLKNFFLMFWVLESLELIFALLWREKNCREDFEYKYVCNYCVQSLWRKGFLGADLCAFTLYLSSNKSFSLILSVWNFHSTFPGVGLTGVHFHLQQRAVPLLSFSTLYLHNVYLL